MDESEDDQQLAVRQRLKAAIHYTVGKICEESARDMGVKYDRQFIAALAEVTCKQCKSFACDSEMFAKHAKRSTISPEDVKLLVRKSPHLHQHIQDMHTDLGADKEEAKKPRARNKEAKKKTISRPSREEDEEEDSNMVD